MYTLVSDYMYKYDGNDNFERDQVPLLYYNVALLFKIFVFLIKILFFIILVHLQICTILFIHDVVELLKFEFIV